MERLQIGFVGAGKMGQCAHLRNYALLPDCQVTCLAELRGELGRMVAQRYGIPNVYRSHEEMLANEKLDAIVASQPFWRHGVLVPELLKAGVPLFIEKPIAHSVEIGEKIVKAVESSGTWIMVGYHKRSDPATEYAVRLIGELKRSGDLGSMKYVRITMPPGDWIAGGFDSMIKSDENVPPLPSDPPPGDMGEQDFKEYVKFVNYYIHQVNLMRHLFGENYSAKYADSSGTLLALKSKSGTAGVIEMAPYRTTLDWRESALVGFEKGYIKLRLPAPLAANRAGRVEFLSDKGDGAPPTITRPILQPEHAMKRQAVNFLKAVRGEAQPMTTACEALDDLNVARDYMRLFKGI